MPPVVVLRELTRAYGDVVRLDRVSFEVEPGECVAILGPNGAGKSTLLALLCTIRRPTSGDATVVGQSITTQPHAVRRVIGILFQEPLVAKHLTAREVLLHHAALYGVGRADRAVRAEGLLAFAGLMDRADDKVRTFSGGMKRRLDLARVLMTEPKVLILDEPTSGLDVRARGELHAKVRELVARGTTVILATHDLDEAHRLARRVLILDHGRLLAYDTPTHLSRRLGHRVVRVEFDADDVTTQLRAAVNALQTLGEVSETGDGIELVIPQDGPGTPRLTPGTVVDALENARVRYSRVTVREPNLGDVFLGLTGRSLAAPALVEEEPA